MKWIGAAWVKGALDDYDPIFREEMSPHEFKDVFVRYYEDNFNGGWMFFAGMEEVRPIGFVVAWVRGRIIEIGAMIWFPWASQRNIIESAANFFDSMRKEVWDASKEVGDPLRYSVVLEFAQMKDKRFFEHLAKRGLLRRVGHVMDLYPDAPSVLFQTKSPVR